MNRLQIHHSIYVLLVAALCVAIPLSNYMMSMMLIFLAANWLIEWDFKAKWQRLKENKSAILAFFFLLVIMLGFVRADNSMVALDYWTTKLPLYMAPLIVASSQPLNRKELTFALTCFIASVLFATVYSTVFYATHEIADIREISVFISHIRFSLCIDVAIVLLLHSAFQKNKWTKTVRFVAGIVSLWFLVYLFIAQTLTGILLLFAVALAYLVYLFVHRWNENIYRWTAVALLGLLAIFLLWVAAESWRYFHVDKAQNLSVDAVTVNGHPYENDPNSIVENGSPIGMYVCEEELEKAWAMRSEHSLDEPLLKESLIRYLNSCHLRKDSVGVMALSDADVRNVEQHIANVDYTSRFGVRRALYPIFFSLQLYSCSGDVQNSSLLQRVEYWRASWQLVQQHWLLGVGLGNHKTAVGKQLVRNGSSLVGKDKTGCHNQWLTLWLMGGIVALLYFVLILVYPFFEQKRKISFVYIAFFIILVGSMFTEDTLETQAGLTLFAVMNSILLYAFNLRKDENAGTNFTDNGL